MRTSPGNPLPQFSLFSFGPRTPERSRLLRLLILMKTASVHPGFSLNKVLLSPRSVHRLAVCKCLIELKSRHHAGASTASRSSRRIAIREHSPPPSPLGQNLAPALSMCCRESLSSPAANTVQYTAGSHCMRVHSHYGYTDTAQFPRELTKRPARRIVGSTPWTSDFEMNMYRPLARLAHGSPENKGKKDVR